MITQYIIKSDRGTFYYKNKEMTLLHREDGPAVEWGWSGDKEWWIDNQLHREDGPAFEGVDGTKEWYYKGKALKVTEHKKLTTTISIEGKSFTIEELKALIEKATI